MKLGDIDIHVISDGTFKLDGGAMFGIVPKSAWEKAAPVDEFNRITLGLNTLLIRTNGRRYLVDTGIGDKHDAKWGGMYDVRRPPSLMAGLTAEGIAPDQIDGVILSHLHFDHAGGATTRDGVPAFPRATYYVQEGAWAEALDPNPRTKGSYRPADFLALEKRTKLLKGDVEIDRGVRVKLTGGHVNHHQVVVVEGGGRTAIFWADLLPTTAHLKSAWVMGYDIHPSEVATLKSRMLREAIAGEWIQVFDHDPAVSMAVVRDDGKGGFRVEPVDSAISVTA